jgi:hypothetical protein
MPLVVLTSAQQIAGLKTVQPDLRFLFEEVGVRAEVQGVLGHHDFGRLNRFAGLETSLDGVRTVLETEFGLDPTASLAARGDMCDLLAAWEAARAQTKKESELRAESNFNETARPASQAETKAMLASFELSQGVLEHRLIPSRYLLGKKLEELMENQPEVERLIDITSKEDGDEEILQPQVGKDGRIFVKKGAKKEILAPRDAEELRLRYRVLTNAWVFAASKHPNRTWLIDFDAERSYGRLADYLLGPKVAMLTASPDYAKPTEGPTPSFAVVLHYEFEIRKAAYELVRLGTTSLDQGLRLAMRDAELRMMHFLQPFSFQLSKGKHGGGVAMPTGQDTNKERIEKKRLAHNMEKERKNEQNRKTQKLAAAKAAAAKTGKVVKGGKRHDKTPDGRQICFSFNIEEPRGGPCSGKCGRVHVCQYCFSEDHPSYKHGN